MKKDEILDRLNSMNPQDVAKMVSETWANTEDSWTDCKDCIYFQERDCELYEIRDGCFCGEKIENVD